jgi:hypothetical protein
MNSKTSLVLAAFAAAIAAQPAAANTATSGTHDTSIAGTLSLVRPSTAAVDKLKHLIEGAKVEGAKTEGTKTDVAAMNAKPFPRVFIRDIFGPTFVRWIKKG